MTVTQAKSVVDGIHMLNGTIVIVLRRGWKINGRHTANADSKSEAVTLIDQAVPCKCTECIGD